MTNVKCIRCGVVNVVANEVCKVCGVELRPPLAEPLAYPQPRGSFYQPEPPAQGLEDDFISPFHGVGDVLWPSFRLFFKKFWLITKIVVVVVAPFQIFKVMSLGEGQFNWQLTLGIVLLDLICKMLIAPALIYSLTSVLKTGEEPSVSEAYRNGLSSLGKLAVCAFASWTLQAIGFLLLIIPGIIVWLALSVVYPVAVLEKRSVIDTLSRSWNLTKGRRLEIFLASIAVAIFTWIIGIPVSWILMPGSPVWPISVLGAILTDIFGQLTTVLSLVIYLSIIRLDSKQLSNRIGGDVLGPDHPR